MPTVYNAANELAVKKFLERAIGYLTITDIIGKAMKRHKVQKSPSVEDILAIERETYEFIESRW